MTPDNSERKWSPVGIAALGEWLLVLPSAVFIAAAALRELAPRQFEPSRTSWAFFEWTVAHITHAEAAVLFLVLPAAALVVGCALLLSHWRKDSQFRQDIAALFTIAWRQIGVGVATSATLLAGTILAMVIAHLIVG